MDKVALIMVDVQNDFLPGGSLAVSNGDEVIQPLLQMAKHGDLEMVVASQDFHPVDHCSFVANGGEWPPHCVQGEKGAEIVSDIAEMAEFIVQKGMDRDKEQYSAFDGTDLAERLRSRGISTVLIGGLATDYCIKATASDALAAGFRTLVLVDAVRAVFEEGGMQALKDLVSRGAHTIETGTLLGARSHPKAAKDLE